MTAVLFVCSHGNIAAQSNAAGDAKSHDAAAANDSTTVLKGVTVHGARVVQKADRTVFYPTKEQRESAASGYGLLKSLALPELKVDEHRQTISSQTMRGEVQVRINGILADASELVSLDCHAVTAVEYTDRPGVRYGEGIGHVVNIITRRAVRGYTIGTNLTNTITSAEGSNRIFARRNNGKSQWEASYGMTYSNETDDLSTHTAAYTLPDGTIYNRFAADLPGRTSTQSHDLSLAYNRADSGRYVVQAKVGGLISRQPEHTLGRQIITTTDGTTTAFRTTKDNERRPDIDIYWQQELGKHQSVTANAVGTGFITEYSYHDTESNGYAYNIKGRSWSLNTEAIYENRLHPFTMTAGLQYRHKRIDNRYTGDADSHSRSRTQTVYMFGQLSGRMWNIAYTAGIGASFVSFSQQPYDYTYLLFRPKLQLSRQLFRHLTVSYDIELSQHTSAIANANDVTLRKNPMEMERGNPALRPTGVLEQTFRLALATQRLWTMTQVYYKRNHRPNMMEYQRENDDDGHTLFIYTQKNQPGCHLLAWMNYTQWQAVPGHLAVTVSGNIFRCFNYGDTYRHFNTSYNGSLSMTAWLGAWTLTAGMEKGFEWMEGEVKGRLEDTADIRIQWRHKSLAMSLLWSQPLRHDVRTLRKETQSRYVHKVSEIHSTSSANRLSLNIVWTLNKGRNFHDINRTMDNRDRDSGVMK